jgi:S-adenosylmethionine:tRNA ribosyltransferase-isomerase
MLLSQFDYELPEAAIAQVPMVPRDASRLLVLHRDTGAREHRVFREVLNYLQAGDTLVLNDTRVIPARVRAVKETGGRVELLLLARRAPGEWEASVRPGRRVPPGARLYVPRGDLQVEVLSRTAAGGRVVRVSGAEDADAALLAAGEVPLPPYIHHGPIASATRRSTPRTRARPPRPRRACTSRRSCWRRPSRWGWRWRG